MDLVAAQITPHWEAFDFIAWITLLCGAVGLAMVQRAMRRSPRTVFAGSFFIAVAAILMMVRLGTSPEELLFAAFGFLAGLGAVLFLVLRQPVHAALGFALTVLATCGLFFLQSAPFVAAATMVVYAGATIIIFLFVLMFAQRPTLESYDIRLHFPRIATAIGAILLAVIIAAIVSRDAIPAPRGPDLLRPSSSETTAAEPSRLVGLGRALFTDYLWTVELAGTLLLVATVGAVVLAQSGQEEQA